MRQQFFGNTKWIGCLLSLGLLAIVGGCGKSTQVTGKVTYQGRTVVHGSVIFLGADNKARSGVIEPDGSYAVEGIRLGEARIAVISRAPSKGRSVRRMNSRLVATTTANLRRKRRLQGGFRCHDVSRIPWRRG